MNRKVFIEGIKNDFKYDFGANYALITAVMNLPKFENVSTITYSVRMSGKELKIFLKENEVDKKVIDMLLDDYQYNLEAWDY